jgi:soluble lytic murein transglycosylase-like protein
MQIAPSRWLVVALLGGLSSVSALALISGGAVIAGGIEQRQPDHQRFDALFQRHAKAQGVDWRLLKAIAQVESSLNPRAEHPNGLSSGLMQVYCAPAGGSVCRNRFDINGWPPPMRDQLYEPDYNMHIATQILAWNLRTYGLARGVAVYNSWGARLTRSGQPFPNQAYVDRVLQVYREMSP